MAKGMGWSSSSVFLLGFVELIAGLGLILGFYAEIGALLVGLIMLGAAISIIFLGAGEISLDFLFGLWP